MDWLLLHQRRLSSPFLRLQAVAGRGWTCARSRVWRGWSGCPAAGGMAPADWLADRSEGPAELAKLPGVRRDGAGQAGCCMATAGRGCQRWPHACTSPYQLHGVFVSQPACFVLPPRSVCAVVKRHQRLALGFRDLGHAVTEGSRGGGFFEWRLNLGRSGQVVCPTQAGIGLRGGSRERECTASLLGSFRVSGSGVALSMRLCFSSGLSQRLVT